MGFITELSRKQFWHISNGKFVTKCEADAPGAQAHIPTKGKRAGTTCYRLPMAAYEGFIKGVAFVKSQFSDGGEELRISMDEQTIITVSASGAYLTRFAGICDQIDPNEMVRVMPWSMQAKDNPAKTFVGWAWYQFGKKLIPPPEYDPGDKENCVFPQPAKVIVSRKEQYDWTERDNFLIQIVTDWATKHGLMTYGNGEKAEPVETNPHDDNEPL